MKFVILLSILGFISAAPAGNYIYYSFPHTTTAAPTTTAPPPAYVAQPPAAYVPQAPAPYVPQAPAPYVPQPPAPAPFVPPPPATYTNTYTTYTSQNFQPAPQAPTVKYYSANPIPTVTGSLYNFLDTQGQYKFGYSLSDGQAKTETKQINGGVSGQYSYVDPEGKRVELSYVADRDGFRAAGDHLPVAPSVPELPAELAQAYNEAYQRLYKAHEEARLRGETTFDDGSYKPEVTPAAPSAPVPAPAPVVYHTFVANPVQTPVTYSYPVKSSYTYTAPALPVTYVTPATVLPSPKPVYSSSQYNTNVGAPTYVHVPAPVVPTPAPVVPVPVVPVTPVPFTPTKSAYIGNPY